MTAERLLLFDTTLRDGEQAPGFSMNAAEKLRFARALDRLGVDVLEAGFPAASSGDFEAVAAIARHVERARVAALCRCTTRDLETAARALEGAAKPRLHTFLATSPLHRAHKLSMTREQVLERVHEGVARARALCDDVEFSAEDASRTEIDFLVEVFQVALDAGATTLNAPDTVGYALPAETEAMFRALRTQLVGVEGVVLSAHCHDDLGLAVANSLAAVRGGARQVEATICGIGERAGNAALEEVVMAVRARSRHFGVDAGLDVGIDTRRLCPTAELLEAITGQAIPRNKAIVGANAFAHESGIHQHGVLQKRETYEILRAEDVGQDSTLVLGKHSGRHALRARLRALDIEGEEQHFDGLFAAFKELADRKREVHEQDLQALALGQSVRPEHPWSLCSLQTTAGTHAIASAAVVLQHASGKESTEAAVGDGPVDASFRALARASGVAAALRDYRVQSIGVGRDAQGRVTVHCEIDGALQRGSAVRTDIIEASALAFLDAINRSAVARVHARGDESTQSMENALTGERAS